MSEQSRRFGAPVAANVQLIARPDRYLPGPHSPFFTTETEARAAWQAFG
jgi:hypothetical protein